MTGVVALTIGGLVGVSFSNDHCIIPSVFHHES